MLVIHPTKISTSKNGGGKGKIKSRVSFVGGVLNLVEVICRNNVVINFIENILCPGIYDKVLALKK